MTGANAWLETRVHCFQCDNYFICRLTDEVVVPRSVWMQPSSSLHSLSIKVLVNTESRHYSSCSFISIPSRVCSLLTKYIRSMVPWASPTMAYLTIISSSSPHWSGFSLPGTSKLLLVLLSEEASWAKDRECSPCSILGVLYLEYSLVGDVDTCIKREENPLHDPNGSAKHNTETRVRWFLDRCFLNRCCFSSVFSRTSRLMVTSRSIVQRVNSAMPFSLVVTFRKRSFVHDWPSNRCRGVLAIGVPL